MVQLLRDCLMFNLIFLPYRWRRRSLRLNPTMEVSKSMFRVDSRKDQRSSLSLKVHYRKGEALQLLGLSTTCLIKLLMVWLGKARKEELRLNTAELLSSILISPRFLPQTMSACICGSFPCCASCYIFILLSEERPFFMNLGEQLPMVASRTLSPRQIEMILSLLLEYLKSSLRKEFSEFSSKRRETAPSQSESRLGEI